LRETRTGAATNKRSKNQYEFLYGSHGIFFAKFGILE
jgi:hypothetical protein